MAERGDPAQNDGAMTDDERLGPGSIMFNSAIKDREVMPSAEIARMVEKIQKEAHYLEGSLDNLERQLGGEGGQQYSANSTEGNQRSVLDRELKDIEDHFTNLLKDVKALSEGGYFYTYQLLNRVLSLMRRADHLRRVLDNNTTLKPPPRPSKNKMTAQCQQSSDGGKMVETSSALQHVQFCFQWIQDKHALLEGAFYGNDINTVKQALDQHEQIHKEIISFQTKVDKCMTYRVNLNQVQEKQYQLLKSQVKLMYPVLCKDSCQRQECLLSLQDFLQNMTVGLSWMSEKQQFIYDYSKRLDELSIPDEQIYKTFMQEITSREDQIQAVLKKGYTMILEKHPASETVEVYLLRVEYEWSWLKQLLNCLDKHMHDVLAYHQFLQNVGSCEQWITQLTESVNKMKLEKIPNEKLQEMKIECQDLQNAIAECKAKVAFCAKTSDDIIPLKERTLHVTSPVKVYSRCIYKRPNMTQHLQLHEECFLLDNSQKNQWKVTNSRGEEVIVPSICVIIPPPNFEAKALVDRLKTDLESLKILIETFERKLAENRVVLIINFIKSRDFGQFRDASKCEKLLRKLSVEAASLIELVGKTDLKMQQQLQKELQECNMKVQEVSKKCFKEDFPCQWEKFEMRFEIKKENKCYSSTLYTIMDVSPGQMQYIVGNKDERDSLLEQLGKSNFRGVFELGLLRIFLQKDEDIRKMVENPNYGIHLKKEVIKVLNTRIHADRVIKEAKLSQFGMEDVLQAQQLGHLECIKSWRVKIYIHKSGKGVSIVGREVDKYIQSICKALGQVNKNEPKSERTEDVASNVSETKLSNMKFDTDRDILSETSLEHAEKREEVKKYKNVMVCKKEFGCTKHVTQMLTDSDYAAVLVTVIPEVAVNYISNEVVFQGPSEAVMKAECHLKQYLKSKGFWHEVELAESLIVYKTLKFEEDLWRKISEVYIKFDERKVIFIGEEKLLQTSEDELCKFEQSIKRVDKTYDKITGNYLKLEDVQRSIWEQFENRQIKCCWQVIGCIIRLFYKSDKELKAAMSALEECIVISHLSVRSESDLQEFENYPDVKKLINQNQGRLYRELILKADCVVYVGTHEVIVQIEKLHRTYIADQKYEPPKHSLQILLSQPILAYVRKYLIENMKLTFQVNIQNLNDLSGINISGAEDNVQNAVSQLQKQIKQMSVDIYPLRSPEITNTIDRQVKEIVATVEEETKTVIEIVSLPRRGKDTMRVKVCDKLDVCLVYGSTPGREVDIQLIPVNNSFFPVCLASVDIMDKGVRMHAEAVNRYFAQYVEKQKKKKPEAFQFAYDDSGSSHHIVYFVMPVDLNDIEDFEEKVKCGILAVLNDASQKKRTSLSIPLEMHEKLSAKQMVMIIMETIKSFLDEIPQHTSIKEIILCSVEICNQSLLRKVLDAVTPDEQSVEDYVIDDFFGCEEGLDSHVDIAIVTGTLLEQQVEVIVNLTTKELNLADGYLTKIILDAAGSTIQDECRNSYQEGIKFGEIAVTSAGKLKFRRIFHGALCLPDANDSHLLSLRSLMKNCLKKAQEERCQSIAFPALGIGRLKYPVDVVAKEMFRAVTSYAMRFGIKRVKFVLPEKDTDCLGVCINLMKPAFPGFIV